jgi:hypothetical protein
MIWKLLAKTTRFQLHLIHMWNQSRIVLLVFYFSILDRVTLDIKQNVLDTERERQP